MAVERTATRLFKRADEIRDIAARITDESTRANLFSLAARYDREAAALPDPRGGPSHIDASVAAGKRRPVEANDAEANDAA